MSMHYWYDANRFTTNIIKGILGAKNEREGQKKQCNHLRCINIHPVEHETDEGLFDDDTEILKDQWEREPRGKE